MKSVSLRDLKRRLSAVIAEVEEGTEVLVTRHRRPVARITSADLEHVHVGNRWDRARIEPLLRGPTQGRYLAVLLEDRGGGAAR